MPITREIQIAFCGPATFDEARFLDRGYIQLVLDLLTPGHNPPVHGYALRVAMNVEHAMADLRLAPLAVEGANSRFDPAVFLWDLPTSLHGAAEYCTDLFHEDRVRRLVGTLEDAAGALAGHPDLRLDEMAASLRRRDGVRRRELARDYRERMRRRLARGGASDSRSS